MSNIISKLKSRNSLVFFSLALVTFIALFIRFRGFGMYGDDWGAGSYLLQHSTADAIKGWINWRGEIDNFRYFAIIVPALWYFSYHLLGLPGVFLSMAAIYVALYFCAYKILSQRVSPLAAYLATVIFILYPTNNFYLWQVTTTYPLALVFVFLAVWYYWKKNWAAAFLLLTCSAMINEAVLFIFVFALIPDKPVNFKEILVMFWRWLKLTFSLVIIYGATRAAFEYFGFIHTPRLSYSAHNLNLISYAAQFFKATAAVLGTSWAFVAWKILHNFHPSQMAIGLVVIAIFVETLWLMRSKSQAWAWPIIPYWYLFVAGVVLIFAGRYYGFYYVPSVNILNLDSRYYFASSVGGLVFFAGLIEFFLQEKFGKFKNWLLAFLCILVGVLSVFKYEVQTDYVVAWQDAKSLWKQVLAEAPSLSRGEVLVVDLPAHPLGTLVDIGQSLGDFRLFVPKIYGPDTTGFGTNIILGVKKTPTSICINSGAVLSNYCTQPSKVYFFQWHDSTLLPVGDSKNLQARQVNQNVPEEMLKILSH